MSEESKEEEERAQRCEVQKLQKEEKGQRTTGATNLMSARSSDGAAPLVGPPWTSLTSSAFEVKALTTRTGFVHHTDRKCQYLRHVHTGLCAQCAEVKSDAPQRGDTIKINDWGSPSRHVDGCFLSLSFKKFSMCLVCQGNGALNAPTKH